MSTMQATILLIEDNPGDARLIQEMLKDTSLDGTAIPQMKIEHAGCLSDGLGRLNVGGIHLILLDLGLPDSQGIETFNNLKSYAVGVPVIVLTGLDDSTLGMEAVKAGAQDYLNKGNVAGDSLARIICYAMEREHMTNQLRRQSRELAIMQRLYVFLSEINQTIVRVADKDALLKQCCQIAVSHGRFMMADISLRDSTTGRCTPVAHAEEINCDFTGLIPPDEPKQSVMCYRTQALSENRVVVVNDVTLHESACSLCARLSNVGIRSSAALPLHNGGDCIGIISFYMGQKHFFNDQELAVLRELAGDISYALQSIEDRQKRSEAERAFKRERDMLITLLNQTQDVIFFQDNMGCFTKVSKSMADIFEVTPKLLIGKTVHDILPEESAVQKYVDDQQVIASGQPMINRIEYIGQFHGRAKWTSTTKVPWVDTDGHIIGLIGIARDISEIKQAENELRKLTRAIDQSPVSVMITDIDGSIEYVNPKFSQLTGYSMDEVRGKNPSILKSDRSKPEEYRLLWETIKSGHEWRGQFHNRKKNGELFWEQAIISPIRSTEGVITHFVAVKEDITERKRMEQMLLQSEKMASIGTLAAGVAHEINNPIGYIQSNLGILLSHQEKIGAWISGVQDVIRTELSDTPARCQTMLGRISAFKTAGKLDFILQDMKDAVQESLEGVQRVGAIIKDLRDFSRSGDEQGYLAPADIHEGLDKTLNIVWNELKYKAEVKKNYGDLPPVECDLQRLNQVFLNLLVNAAHAIEERGAITVATRHAGDAVIIEITDTGVGIPPADQKKIFDAFYTTKAPGKGTGLGLSIAYRIIQDHHGTITVDSAPGAGATFRIVLPVTQKRLVVSGYVLIVEDDNALLTLMKNLIAKNYPTSVIRTATDGFEAAQMLGSFHPDLVLLDYHLPGMNGLDICRRIKSMPDMARTKVIFLTGDTAPEVQVLAREAAVDAFLEKPVHMETLLKTVQRFQPITVAADAQ